MGPPSPVDMVDGKESKIGLTAAATLRQTIRIVRQDLDFDLELIGSDDLSDPSSVSFIM